MCERRRGKLPRVRLPAYVPSCKDVGEKNIVAPEELRCVLKRFPNRFFKVKKPRVRLEGTKKPLQLSPQAFEALGIAGNTDSRDRQIGTLYFGYKLGFLKSVRLPIRTYARLRVRRR